MLQKVQKTRFETQALRHLLMRKQGWLMGLMGGLACLVQAQTNCNRPLQFKDSIRVPDRWEEAWESQAPDASKALAEWRAENFDRVQQAWRLAAPCLEAWSRETESRGLPASAAWLPLWRGSAVDASPACDCAVPASWWDGLAAFDGVEALAWMSNQLPPESVMPMNAWVSHVRSGVRLLENLALPPIHVVQPGETVYQLGRRFNVSPKCIGERNGVWDSLEPGHCLIIPMKP